MTRAEYQRLTLAKMQKRRWRLVREVSNGYVVIPAGTEVSITGKQNGVHIEGQPCSCCGVQPRCRKVGPEAIREIVE